MAAEPEPTAEQAPPETIHDYFMAQLKRFRHNRNLSQVQLAEAIHFSPGLVSMVENGQRRPSPDFTTATDRVLDTGGILTGLLPMLMRETYPTWFRSFVALEARALILREFESQLIPGLFQTAAYARTIITTYWPPRTQDEAERTIEARLDRQKILDREEPPLITAIVDESVLHRPVGGTKVMAEQLRHLVRIAARPRVRLHVLTYEQSALCHLDGPFTVLDLPNRERLAYVQALGNGQVLPDPDEVEGYATRYDAIRGEALPTTASISYINRVIEERYEHG